MRPATHLATLRQVGIFADLDKSDLARVARLTTLIRTDAGRVLMQAGDAGREVVLLIEGRLRVERRRDGVLDGQPIVLERGDVVGEMALFDHQPRNATVICETECIVGVMNRAEFVSMLDQIPRIALRLRTAARTRRNSAAPVPA